MNTIPPCPHSNCKSINSNVIRFGYSPPTKVQLGERRARFRCKQCAKTFVINSYSIDLGSKKIDPSLNQKIFSHHLHGLSNRSIGRLLKISEHCVRIRLKKMSHWAFDFHAKNLENIKLSEPICMDGLQNFAGSQYDPNYINQCVGRDSLFVYDFNLSPMNRSGKMSPWQKRRRQEIEAHLGRYHPSSIRIATTTLLKRIHELKKNEHEPLKVLSDEHFQYRKSIRKDLKQLSIEHTTISGKACRNFQNILFPVNHADLMVRQRMASFARETISFSRSHSRMTQRFILFLIHKNYMAPQFTKKHLRRPDAHIKSPAQLIKIEEKLLTFSDIFSAKTRQKTKRSAQSHAEWKLFQQDIVPDYCLRSKRYNRFKQQNKQQYRAHS